MRLLTLAEAGGCIAPGDSRWCERQIANSHQVIDRQCEAEHPIDPCHPAMAGLAQPADGLEPTEDLFHPLADTLTNRIARMPGGALIDDTGWLARKMRGHLMIAHLLNQCFAV